MFISKNSNTFVVKSSAQMKHPINWPLIWQSIQHFIKNKYIIASLIFAIIFLFVGQQSLISDVRRARQIQKAKAELKQKQAETERAKNDLELLSQTDSLERFAREKYYMHADNEDVYIIK